LIDSLNARRPQCPVLFSEIKFSYLDSFQRVRNAQARAERESQDARQSGLRCGPVHVPSVDLFDIHEEHRSFVFPACGHVHGYHKSLDGRPCPLCRTQGVFMPIAFAFESSCLLSYAFHYGNENLDDVSNSRDWQDHHPLDPTHVFNPCGHVASLSVVRHWSSLLLFSKAYSPPWHLQFNQAPFSSETQELFSICPFCAIPLDNQTPFSKLVLQCENGFNDEGRPVDRNSNTLIDDVNRQVFLRSCEWEHSEFQRALISSQKLLVEREKKQQRMQWKNSYPCRELIFPSYAPHIL
jgi:hypothetical protein